MDDLLPYLAGCIDCDGFISVVRHKRPARDGSEAYDYVAILGLGQITPLIPTLMQATFGGQIAEYVYKDRPRSNRAYNWQITNARAATALRALRPYLRLKTEQADLAIQLADRVQPGRRLSPEEIGWREATHQRVTSLNHGRRWNHRETLEHGDPLATP